MTISVADLISEYLVTIGAVDAVVEGAAWPGYLANKPEDPDDVVVFYDTNGTMEKREQRTGYRVEHPGLQILVRCGTYRTGYRKAQALGELLDTLHNATVTIEEVTYKIKAVQRTTPVVSIGKDDRRREVFTLNALVTFGEVT